MSDDAKLDDISIKDLDLTETRHSGYKVPPARLSGSTTHKFLTTFHHIISNINKNHSLDTGISHEEQLSDIQKLFEFFTPFPFRSSLPLPILEPLMTPNLVSQGQDPATLLSDNKRKFHQSLNAMLRKNLHRKARNLKAVEVVRESLEELGAAAGSLSLPPLVKSLATKIDQDPDRTFDCNYNWYYTGGNVASTCVQGRTVVLAARGEECNHLHAVPLKRSSLSPAGFRPQEERQASVNMGSAGTIFEVVTQEQGEQGLVVVRLKNECHLYQCGRASRCTLRKLHYSVSLRDSFTSVALSPWQGQQYCTTNTKREVLVWDITANKSKRICRFEDLGAPKGQWCGLHYSYSAPNCVFFSDAVSVRSIDLRHPKTKPILLELRNLSDLVSSCESITVSRSSVASSNIQYVATSHQLISMDVRRPGLALQRWSHLLRGPPQFVGLSCDTLGRELVCLAGTERSEVVGVVNEWPDEDLSLLPVSRSQPYLLCSLEHTLKEAKLRGLCLEPGLQERLKLGLTGLCCVSSSRPAVLSATAAGDVFYQRVAPKFSDPDPDEELLMTARLTYWQEKVAMEDLKRPLPTLYLSERLDASHLVNEVLRNDAPPPSPPAPQPVLPTWQLTHQQLFSSKDIFSRSLLAAWGIKDAEAWEAERAKGFGESSKLPVMPSEVERWLSTVMPTESQESATPWSQQTMTQESVLVSVSQQESFENLEDVVFLKQQPLSKYTTKFPAKKRKRTDGF